MAWTKEKKDFVEKHFGVSTESEIPEYTTYSLCVPLRTTMYLSVEGKKGLNFWEVVDLVDDIDLMNSETEVDMGDIRDAMNDIGNWTYIQDLDNQLDVDYCERPERKEVAK